MIKKLDCWHEIEWILPRYETYAATWVSVQSIEEIWKLDTSDYIGPGGTGKSIDDRYQGVGIWFQNNRSIWTPVMCLDEIKRPSFTDGRHRFAWARDHQVEALQVVVPPDEQIEFRRLYGTPIRTSRWCSL